MKYDTLIIGAGLSGLTAAALLAKRGIKVAVIEQSASPGGSCGIFKRNGVIFDQGAAMLYGFGEQGFNSHRFVFNCLEEPIQLIKHELLYVVHYHGKTIRFFPDINQFIEELSHHFPGEATHIRRFYKDMQCCYSHVISDTPTYTTPDETNPKDGLKSICKHPISYLRFLSYLNISAEKLLKKYFSDPEILDFFSKLTSTYCYADIKEAPAILASVMFIDNHVGGSYYPAGSTLFLPGKLEKVIEKHNGDMYYNSKVTQLIFHDNVITGVQLWDGSTLFADNIIYSGNVWDLYQTLLPSKQVTPKEQTWVNSIIPTYPSVVFYGLVNKDCIPPGTSPIEMLTSNGKTDETEITLYLLSLDDPTLCPSDQQVVIAIGPSFKTWCRDNSNEYKKQKEREKERFCNILEGHFPGFNNGLIYWELATPLTLERFCLKYRGACAGPKQMLGQHMLLRQSIKTRWNNLFVCGESTTMGTGTPTVTTSGVAAANAILSQKGLKRYQWSPNMKNYVEILSPPLDKNWMQQYYTPDEVHLMSMAQQCNYCQNPTCCSKSLVDIPGIMRRISCGNFYGARKLLSSLHLSETDLSPDIMETSCIRQKENGDRVPLAKILQLLTMLT